MVLGFTGGGCGSTRSSPDNPLTVGGLTLTSLRTSALFRAVHEAGQEPPSVEGPTLRLRGVITRLGRGNQAARWAAGLFGGGAARAQADMHFLDVASNRVVLATADRRLSSFNPSMDPNKTGGSPESVLTECFNDMARDFGRFLVRLSKGQPPAGVR